MSEQLPQNAPERPEERVDLHQLLTYENPKLAQYLDVIKGEFAKKRHQYGQDFSHSWLPVFYDRDRKGTERFQPADYKKVLPYLQDRLQEGLLIDLGGNLSKSGTIVQLAKKCGARVYINVDTDYVPENAPVGEKYNPYVGKKREEKEYSLLSEEENKRIMEAIDVQADILNFIARLPDNSANFTLNGIDSHIIETGAYWDALEQEITRTAKIGGVIFGYGSEMMFLHHNPKWKSVGEELEFDDGSTYIQQKIFERVA